MAAEQLVMVEVLSSNNCSRCKKTKILVSEVIEELKNSNICYREVDVVEEIDYAVKLGVTQIPAIAINGELLFVAPPPKTKLRDAIIKCLKRTIE
ncbi:MAG: thioredoxin family protein [Pseudomonadales bacterium]|nr:thioredoxin family protein [Pseudomonadales bacterium]